MSIRRGYYFLAGDQYDGPFRTVREAQEAATPFTNHHHEVTIRAMVSLEKFDPATGEWVTVH